MNTAKKRVVKELTWILAIALTGLVYQYLLIPILIGNMALDIKNQNTHYISPRRNSLWILIPALCFVIYLVRAIITRFNNILILLILGVSTVFIIGWLLHLD